MRCLVQLVVGLALAVSCLADLCPVLDKQQVIEGSKGAPNVLLIHPIEDYLIVASYGGNILKVHKSTLQVIGQISGIPYAFVSGVLWYEGDSFFLGTQGFPALIYRFSLSEFELQGTITLNFPETHVSSLLILPPSAEFPTPVLLASIRAVPASVVLFDITSGSRVTRGSTLKLLPVESYAQGLTYNSLTQRVVVLTDSIPPHIVELTRSSSKALSRSLPAADVPLPLAPHHESPQHPGLTQVTMVCHSSVHGDRIFLSTDSSVIRINTTHASAERILVSKYGPQQYITSPEMFAQAGINNNHNPARACAQDPITRRLYVATRLGLLTYDTRTEPFGQREVEGARCEVQLLGNLAEATAVVVDPLHGQAYVASMTTDSRIKIHRLNAVPMPEISRDGSGVTPSALLEGSAATLMISGSKFTDLFGSNLRVGFAKIISGGHNGEEYVLNQDDLREHEAPFESETHLSVAFPSYLSPGRYLVTVRELNGALVSNGVELEVYAPPEVISVSPSVARSEGTLVTVHGKGFTDTGKIRLGFLCNGEKYFADARYESSEEITARSPAMSASCKAPVAVSLNGVDWLQTSPGHVFFVNPELKQIDPPIMTVRGGVKFEIKIEGLDDSLADVLAGTVVELRPRSLALRNPELNHVYRLDGTFNEDYSTLFGTSNPFLSPGTYAVDLYLGEVKITDSTLSLEVVELTVTGLSPTTATSEGGVDVQLQGKGFPHHNALTVMIVPTHALPGSSETEIGVDINDDGTEATFRLPSLPPGEYHISLHLSSAEDISLSSHTLSIRHAPSLSLPHSPSCALLDTKVDISVSLLSSSTELRQDLQFFDQGAHMGVKCVPAEYGVNAKEVETHVFFAQLENVVTASAVSALEGSDDDGPHLSFSATFRKAGSSYTCFVTGNRMEWVRAEGSVYVYSFTPETLLPTMGPARGQTHAQIKGPGYITQCGGVSSVVRFRTRDGPISFTRDVPCQVLDLTTLVFDTPDVSDLGLSGFAGTVTAEVNLDGSNWIALPVELPLDNFLYYNAVVRDVSPHFAASVGGSTIYLTGEGFPNTEGIIAKFGDFTTVPVTWHSPTSLSLTLPPLPPSSYDILLSFNGYDFEHIDLSPHFFTYTQQEQERLGLFPIAGSVIGGTTLSLTMTHGSELSLQKTAVRFLCPGSGKTVDVLVDSNPIVDEAQETDMYTISTPVVEEACSAEIWIARNGVDFRPSGHHFVFYDMRQDQTAFRLSPAVLVEGQDTVISGSGFVDTSDETSVRFSNADSQSQDKFVSAEVTFNDSTELVVRVPDLSSLFSHEENPRAHMAITFNGQEWFSIGDASVQSAA